MNEQKNYWPMGLLAFGAVICGAIIALGYIALTHTWEMDESFMSNYKNVDKNYNEIARAQKTFEEKYDVKLDASTFSLGQNVLKLSVLDKNGSIVNGAQITAIVTRPDTNSLNQTIQNFIVQNGEYISPTFTLDKPGRWIVEYKIDVNQTSAYFKVTRQIPHA